MKSKEEDSSSLNKLKNINTKKLRNCDVMMKKNAQGDGFRCEDVKLRPGGRIESSRASNNIFIGHLSLFGRFGFFQLELGYVMSFWANGISGAFASLVGSGPIAKEVLAATSRLGGTLV